MIEPRDSAFQPRSEPGVFTAPILPFPSNMLGIEALARAGLVVEEQFRTRIGDEFRITAGRVQALVEANIAAGVPAANTVMVTSTRPGEGKSFSSVNLAATLAQLRRRPVLLVDIDSKPGSFTDLAGLLGRPGLFELVGNADRDPRAVIVPTVIPGLSVLPLGNPMAARELCPLQATLVALGEQFPDNTLLLDAGPCLATSDPSVLAPTVGQIVMVVEAERTQRSEVEAALDLVRSCPRIALLLNKAASRTSAAFGAYGTYGAYYARPSGAPRRG